MAGFDEVAVGLQEHDLVSAFAEAVDEDAAVASAAVGGVVDAGAEEWQRDLSISHNNLGDLAQAAGDLTAAGRHYQTGLDVPQRLAAADPTNSKWQRDLSFLKQRLAELRDMVDGDETQ